VINRAAIVIGGPGNGRVVLRLVAVGVGMVVPADIWSRSWLLMKRRTVVGVTTEVNVRLCHLAGQACRCRLWKGKPSQDELKQHCCREHQPYRRCYPVPRRGRFCSGGPLVCHQK